MVRRPKIVFLLSEALGWRTYAQNLQAALKTRDDFIPVVRTFEWSRALTALSKRNNIASFQRLYPRVDPLCLLSRFFREWWREVRARHQIHTAFAAAHTMSGVFAETSHLVPFSVVLDHTRVAMEREFHRRAWSAKDCAREAAVLKKATFMFSTSEWVSASLINDYGCDSNRVVTAPLSVDRYLCKPRGHRVWPKPRLLFIGNDLKRKGFDRLLRWWRDSLSEICELHVVSKGKLPPPSPGLVLYGELSNAKVVSEVLPQVDVLCLPTRSDMSAVVAIEAAMCGVPTVATRLGGLACLIEHGRTGILVEREDELGFIQALRRLLTDFDFNEEMGKTARRLALSRFDAGRYFTRLFDALVFQDSSV